jgi:hypothetical protein
MTKIITTEEIEENAVASLPTRPTESVSFGGKALNVAIGVSRLGGAAYVTGLMYNENGYMFENALDKEGVPFTFAWNKGRARENYKFIDRAQKTFCPQLLVEVMASALCCIIEKIRSEQYLDQILGDEEMESGSVGEAVRYFSNTLGWDFSTPDKLSLSTRKFFDGRLAD